MSDTTSVNIDINARSNLSDVLKREAELAARHQQTLASISRRNASVGSTEEFLRRQRAFNEESERLANRRAQAQQRADASAVAGARNVAGELVLMAGQYISVAGAIEAARRAFVGFAQESESLRIIQARTGMLDSQMAKVKETIDRTARAYGQTSEELTKAIGMLVQGGRVSREQAEAMLPALSRTARLFGESLEEMTEGYITFSNILKLTGEEGKKALELMTYGASNFNLNLTQLNKSAPELAGAMRDLGVTGVDGVRSIISMMSILQQRGFGDTRKSATQLYQVLTSLREGSGIAQALGMDTEEWGFAMERASEQGKGLEFVMSALDRAVKEGTPWFKIAPNPNQARAIKAIYEDFKSIDEKFKTGKMSAEDYEAALKKMTESPDQAIRSLMNSIDDLSKAFGSLMVSAGANQAIKAFIAELGEIERLVKVIQGLLAKGLWGSAKDAASGLKMPSFSGQDGPGRSALPSPWEVLKGMMNGPNGGARATGGRVRVGSHYTVGEKGTETFVPDQNGTILPNGGFSSRALETTASETRHQSGTLEEIRDLLRQIAGEDVDGMGGGAGGGGTAGSGGGKMGAMARENIGGSGGSSGGGGGGTSPRNMTGGGSDTEPQAAGAAGGQNFESIAAQRADMFREIDSDPATKQLTKQMMATEGGGGKSLEAMMNRIAMIRKKVPGWSVKQELMSGFYGPINRGQAQRTFVGGKVGERLERYMNQVRQGSDEIEGRTDQGLLTDPNGRGPGRFWRPGMSRTEVYNFWKGSRRGRQFTHQDSANFAAEQQALRLRSQQGGAGATGNRLYVGPNRDVSSGDESEGLDMRRPDAPPVGGVDMDALRERARGLRSELEEPIRLRAQMDYGSDTQFRRSSMRRETDRELRESRYNSYSDIGAA